jgi:hypothetical protein
MGGCPAVEMRSDHRVAMPPSHPLPRSRCASGDEDAPSEFRHPANPHGGSADTRCVQIRAGQRCAADLDRSVPTEALARQRSELPIHLALRTSAFATVAAPSILGGGQHSKHFRKHTGDKGGRSLNNLPIRLTPHRPQATCRSNCRRPHPRLTAVLSSGLPSEPRVHGHQATGALEPRQSEETASAT